MNENNQIIIRIHLIDGKKAFKNFKIQWGIIVNKIIIIIQKNQSAIVLNRSKISNAVTG